MRLTEITISTVEPLDLAETKNHLRVSFAKEDAQILRLITGARQAFERDTGRQLITANLNGFLDCFPASSREFLEIARPPLLAVNSIVYLDTAGAPQTWSSAEYTVKAFAEPKAKRGEVYPSPDFDWPQIRAIRNAITIDFDAGYGPSASDVPAEIKDALLGWISYHYIHREARIVPWPDFDPWRDCGFA